MLSHDASFSIYMAHGGTTFGLWSGCDRPFKPDTSSYDYDAPISEAGWPTEKFFQTRDLFAKYLLPGETLPQPPATNATIAFASVELKEIAPVFDNLPVAIQDATPRNMEAYDQGYGCILYRTKVPAGAAAAIEALAIHDFGYVFLDGQRVGILDRRNAAAKMVLPAREKESRLEILVEPMGRINFGAEMADHKGLIAPVTLGGQELKGWEVFKLPLDQPMLAALKFTGTIPTTNAPAFRRGTFALLTPVTRFWICGTWARVWFGSTAIVWDAFGTSVRRRQLMRRVAGCAPARMKLSFLICLKPNSQKSPGSKSPFSMNCIRKKILPRRAGQS